MQHELNHLLAPAVSRLRRCAAARGAVRALLIGSLLALLVLPARLLAPDVLHGWLIAVLPVVAAMVGAARGFVRGGDVAEAARAVDRTYQLHDQLTTACEFTSLGSIKPFQQKQIADALAAAGRVDVGRAIAWRLPSRAWAVAVLATTVVAMCFVPVGAGDATSGAASGPMPNRDIRASGEALVKHRRQLGRRADRAEVPAVVEQQLLPSRRHAVERYFRSGRSGAAESTD